MLTTYMLAALVALLPAGAIAAQACLQPDSGVGGTGAPQGGIGGTGTPALGGTGGTGEQAGSGLGGTGAAAGGIGGTGEQADSGLGGTGIVGTITGFASVCIGQLEVHYDAATPVSMNGQPSSLNQLALGQVVAMEARPGAKGLTARSIAILNALEGPVTRADPSRGVLEVMGQPVRSAPGINSSRIAVGTPVRVSGLRDARGTVHATRIEAAADLREASAIGSVRSQAGVATLDGLAIVGPSGPAGAELLVRGKWDGRRLQVRERQSDPSLPFAGRVRDVVVEGLVHRRTTQLLQISGFEVRLESAASPGGAQDRQIVEGNRVRVSGRLESGRRITALRIEIEHGRGTADERPSSRRDGGTAESADDGRSGSGDRRGAESGSGSGDRNRGSERSGDRSGGSVDRGGGGSGDRGGGSGDRGSRVEKVEKAEKVDRVEKAEKVERSNKPERVERMERGEKVERPERSQEKVEKTVKPESGRSGRN